MEPPTPQTPTALIVFAKRPASGRVKTRLTPVLTANEAARLYRAFLLDALDQYLELDVDVRLYLTPPGNGTSIEGVPASIDAFEQMGPGLGARMRHAFDETFAAGYERVVVIGTDHPTLPSAFIEEAFVALDAPPTICLGPSTDGGYYLLGMNTFYPALFEEMVYSHDRVFADTLARAARTGAHLAVLPRWYDVDEPDDLQRLLDDLTETPDRAPRTRAVVDALGLTVL